MDEQIVLEMKNVTKRFPGVLALDRVNLTAYEGEIHALCGENGAGKSTLMKILSGSYAESSYEGEIWVDGQRCHFAKPADSESTGIGMIYQEISMHLDMSIAENIFIGRWPKKNGIIDWEKINSETKQYLDRVGLDKDPSIPDRTIIDHASFQVYRGEILGIGGLVGAGRSELVNAIFGKDRKKGGKIILEGQELNIRSPRDAIENGIALVTEDRKADGIVGNMTIAQNITMPNLNAISSHGIMKLKEEAGFADRYFQSLKIKAPGLDTLLQQLSGGNQQKVVLAKWIARAPKVLILDEPTRGIDVSTKYEIYKIMVDLAKRGTAIIMISSELPELISMADRIMVISNNRISGTLEREEFSQERIMGLSAL